MEDKESKQSELKLIRVSLFLKVIIISWSFYLAIKGETWPESIFYLSISILFAGLFVFQVNKYRNKKKGTAEHAEDAER